jgi:hypothetical protein
MQPQVAAVVTRQELIDPLLRRDFHQGLGVSEERAVAADRAREQHPPVLRDAPGQKGRVESFLRAVDPHQHPAQITDGQGIVVLNTERTGVVKRPVADHRDHRDPQGGRHGEGLERVHPSHATRPDEDARSDRGGVFDDLKLRVLALGDNVLAVHLAVADQFGDVLHHRIVRTDRVRGDDVDVCEFAGDCDGLAAADQRLGFAQRDFWFSYLSH